jgi:hypothetical protein
MCPGGKLRDNPAIYSMNIQAEEQTHPGRPENSHARRIHEASMPDFVRRGYATIDG